MNTISNEKLEELQNKFNALQKSKSEDDLIKEDEFILMANYLSEIERHQSEEGFNRKDLATKIKKSASYLTQVFKGNKPLNFNTIALIQKALNIRFIVTAYPKKKLSENVHSVAIEVNSNQFINALPSDLNIQEKPLNTVHTSGISDGSKMYMLNIKERKVQVVNS